MIRKEVLFSVLLIFIGGFSFGQKNLEVQLNQILEREAFDHASVGISVRKVDGDEVFQLQGGKKLIPASSLKLISTLQAIQEFGRDFRFQTRIGYSGKIDRSGTLVGNIVVISSGDPTFGSDRYAENGAWNVVLEEIVSAIQKAGIRCIEGRIEIKTNVFEGQAICPSWPYSDIANYYASGAWGLNFNENKYDLAFTPQVPQGEIATLESIKPEIPNMQLSSEVIVKGPKTGDNAYIYGDPFHYSKIVRGSIPFSNSPFVIKGAVPNPPLSFGYLLEVALEKVKISCQGTQVSKEAIKRSEFQQIKVFRSPSMGDIVQQANYESINLYCEALLKMLGRKFNKEGSFDAGLEYVETKLEEIGISKYSHSIRDGSGLSPRNGIAASSFTQYLVHQMEQMGIDQMQKYLPHVGVSGTVSSLMNGKNGRKSFYLKSGSMGGVLSYTGIFKGKSGAYYALCFMSNNHSRGNRRIRVEAEKIFEALYLNL